MRCYRKMLCVSYKDQVTNEEVGANKIQQAIEPHEEPPDHRKETQTEVVWARLPFTRSGQNHLARHSEKRKKTRQTEKEMGRQYQRMDWPGVRQIPKGSGEQIELKWRKPVVKSSLVPQRPPRLRDNEGWRWWRWVVRIFYSTEVGLQPMLWAVSLSVWFAPVGDGIQWMVSALWLSSPRFAICPALADLSMALLWGLCEKAFFLKLNQSCRMYTCPYFFEISSEYEYLCNSLPDLITHNQGDMRYICTSLQVSDSYKRYSAALKGGTL